VVVGARIFTTSTKSSGRESKVGCQVQVSRFLFLIHWVNLPTFTPILYLRINAGHPRVIPDQRVNGFKVHRSVKMRMEAEFSDEKKKRKGGKYTPRAKFEVEPTWIG
jgi:hypothetical protein